MLIVSFETKIDLFALPSQSKTNVVYSANKYQAIVPPEWKGSNMYYI